MIQVTVSENKGIIESLEITGHSGSAERGRDLVCAAVSGIAFGLCNAMDMLAGCENITVDGNLIRIVVDHPGSTAQTVMKTGLVQLQTIAEQYKRFIRITILEV